MASTLFFDSDKRTKKILNKYASEIERGDVIWTHLQTNEDNVIEEVINEFGDRADFQEDLLEEQRPRLTSFKTHAVLVIKVPEEGAIYSEDIDANILQLSFIVQKRKLISISDTRIPLVKKVMERLSRRRERLNTTAILSTFLDELFEETIDILEECGNKINKMEKEILVGGTTKALFQKAQTIKENLFYISKVLHANLETVKEITYGKYKVHLESDHFNKNIRNRLLYALDLTDTSREAINGLTNLYLTMLSHKMNENVHRLAIIGALLLIPAIIAGLFGMNVPLPDLDFWTIVILSFMLALFLASAMKIKRWV